MKKVLALLVALSMMFIACACSASAGQVQVMTSFYPLYIFALNVFDGVDSVTVSCMTTPSTGCLHDYQLLASDMMKLAKADMLIVCGAGMENYLGDVQVQFPNLPVVDCSAGIDLIAEDEHEEAHHHHHDEDGEAYNAHTWLDAQNAIQIVQTIAQSAAAMMPAQADKIASNAQAYCERLAALDAQTKELLAPDAGRSIVTFHEAFPYFARAYGLHIAAVMSDEHEDSLSPKALREVIETVRAADNPPLFTEPGSSSVAAQTISQETGAGVYELDPIVTGEATLDTYETRMLNNAYTLKNALEQ